MPVFGRYGLEDGGEIAAWPGVRLRSQQEPAQIPSTKSTAPPMARSMTRVRRRVKELTGRNRSGVRDVRILIEDINPVLRGWGNYFRTGNAARKFNQVDTYVWNRLHSFMVKRKGRHLRPGEAQQWTSDFFHAQGLHRLCGTVRYPEAA